MLSCVSYRLSLLFVLLISSSEAFLLAKPVYHHRMKPVVFSEKVVEVCGFKDCRRAGGGAKLEKQVKELVEEKGLSDTIKVEGCDCQGECGYGPNVLVNGELFNDIKGREAIAKILELEE